MGWSDFATHSYVPGICVFCSCTYIVRHGVCNGSGWDPSGMGGGYDQGQQAYFDSSMGAYGHVPQEQALVPNTVVRILYDYVATERGVLSLRAGDVATLLEHKDQGWCILKTTAGQEGYFPQSYIEPAGAIAAVGQSAVASSSAAIRCEIHNKNRSAANLMQEPNPVTGGVTMRWVCKPGCECKGAVAVAPPSAAQQVANQASHASMLLAAQSAAAEYMAKHAAGQQPADGGSAWALPGYMTTATAGALSSGKPLSASGLTPEQLKAAAAATAAALAGRDVEAKAMLIPSAQVIGKMIVLAPYANEEGAPNAITTVNTGDHVDLLQQDVAGWTMIKTRENIQGYYPTAFLKLKEGPTTQKEDTAAAPASSKKQSNDRSDVKKEEQEPASSALARGSDAKNVAVKSVAKSKVASASASADASNATVGEKREREGGDETTEGESPTKAPCP